MAYGATGGFPPQQLSTEEDSVWQDDYIERNFDISECSDVHRQYKDHVFIVYMHINKSNKHVYVGITHHLNPQRRWGYGGQKYNHCKKFTNAIKKYGWDNFNHIVLCRTSRNKAIILEEALIAFYKRLGKSYNLADGGEGANCFTAYNRERVNERMRTNHPMKNKHHTAEARALISKANLQRVYTEEQKEQLRQAGELGRKTMRSPEWHYPEVARKRVQRSLSKPVLQIDNNGNIVHEFPSTIEVDRTLGCGKGHHVADVCNGKRKSAYGYKWVYKADYMENRKEVSV